MFCKWCIENHVTDCKFDVPLVYIVYSRNENIFFTYRVHTPVISQDSDWVTVFAS